jgi:hypothetical protein
MTSRPRDAHRDTLVLVLLIAMLDSAQASAQQVIVNTPPGLPPRTVPTAATVIVPATFGFTPATPALVQTGQQAGLCNPGACFSGVLSVRANQRWQLQARVLPTAPATFLVNWITPAPARQVRLTTAFTTIANGGTASTGAPTPLLFNAARVTGPGGIVPSAALLSASLEYRVIAVP